MTKTNTGNGNQAGKEGDPPRAMKKTNFVCKDIVKKKRNPQPILTKFFPITKKAKAVRVPKNFQGSPLHECEYEEEVGEYVYRPPNYHKEMEEKKEGTEEESSV
jgi:hypothetical protein